MTDLRTSKTNEKVLLKTMKMFDFWNYFRGLRISNYFSSVRLSNFIFRKIYDFPFWECCPARDNLSSRPEETYQALHPKENWACILSVSSHLRRQKISFERVCLKYCSSRLNCISGQVCVVWPYLRGHHLNNLALFSGCCGPKAGIEGSSLWSMSHCQPWGDIG